MGISHDPAETNLGRFMKQAGATPEELDSVRNRELPTGVLMVDPNKSIDETLSERGSKYGRFKTHAAITQDLKFVMHRTPNWEQLSPSQKEALEMTAHKIGRILNGDPNYHDSWHDINGYIKLVADELLGKVV